MRQCRDVEARVNIGEFRSRRNEIAAEVALIDLRSLTFDGGGPRRSDDDEARFNVLIAAWRVLAAEFDADHPADLCSVCSESMAASRDGRCSKGHREVTW